MVKKINVSKILDPRHFQIFVLLVLVGVQMFWADFGPEMLVLGMVTGAAVVAQVMFSWLFKVKIDIRSAFISSLSLSLLLKSSMVMVMPFVAFAMIASKFLLRVDGKHIFNPSNFGIVAASLVVPNLVWISPGQWGTSVWVGLLVICLAFLVLYRISSADITFFFGGAWVALLFGRALWLGDPMAIPLHSIQNGAFLVFMFFMISDPKTIPDRRVGRLLFALLVAILAFIMQFEFQIRGSLFFALAAVCVVRPVVDKVFKGAQYQWH